MFSMFSNLHIALTIPILYAILITCESKTVYQDASLKNGESKIYKGNFEKLIYYSKTPATGNVVCSLVI